MLRFEFTPVKQCISMGRHMANCLYCLYCRAKKQDATAIDELVGLEFLNLRHTYRTCGTPAEHRDIRHTSLLFTCTQASSVPPILQRI